MARIELMVLTLVSLGMAALHGAPARAQETAPDAAAVEGAPAGDAKQKVPICALAKSYKQCKLFCRVQFPPRGKPDTLHDEAEKRERLKVHGWWSLGAGAALLIGGGIAGGVAIHLNKELSEVCHGGSCEPEYYAEIDTRDRLGITSTVLIAGGVAASAVGILILAVFSRPPKGKGEKSATAFVPSFGPDVAGAALEWRF